MNERVGLASFRSSGRFWAVLTLLGLALPRAGCGAPTVFWRLGTPDGLSAEFAPGARPQLRFVVGQSVPSRDFAGDQGGSVGWDGRMAEKPYTVVFELTNVPSRRCELVLDLVFHTAAPLELKVILNGRTGIFPIRPVAMRPVWGEQGNEMLLARQRLVVPLAGAWLRAGTNELTLIPLGAGSMAYDALTFQEAAGSSAAVEFEPTIFYRKRAGTLLEECEVRAPFEQRFERGLATVHLGGRTFRVAFTNGMYDFGTWVTQLAIPAGAVRGTARIEMAFDGAVHTAAIEAHPAKQWKLFVCPKVHNDVGYTDLQPHVNELDTRNTDQVLHILRRFPFYRFNFETAWLVENYLDCRTGPSRAEFLSRLRQGRVAVNAFYLNLLTGLCTGEELYRALYFTHHLHRTERGNFDFACLTDAPSHSWFLPTLLRDVGVKGFANGANQTRAPILHQSTLNEDSPFWWEGVNGERLLMWYARSYVQLKRLVGPGWGRDISSVEYLRRSVPQFLARYLRQDYAPDAVMIYGAYVDNAAIPETGEADTIAAWNRQFEFPKLIVATDGEYHRYIETRFGARLPVYRGDCGAYWEDGAASTAQATALNRQTQRLLPAAETAAALASIFEPRQRYPAEEFRSAWRNVLFYNEHTWGAHNSIAQPGCQFVERQWEIKENYATRANLDARNLLARAHNRLAQVIAVDGSSVIVFNWQNRPRTAPLEVELGSGEQLVDLSDGRVVPLDIYAEQDGWRKVRFLAADVPALGYKVYAIRPWNAAAHRANEPSRAETIENRFYRLTVDRRTGALKSLFDKIEGRELLDPHAARGLNEYLYVSGGEGSQILNCNFGTPPAQLVVETPGQGEIVETVRTPLGWRITVEARCRRTPRLRTEYRLYDALRRVDIVNTVEKEPTRAKEAVYFAFPFAATAPQIEYQIQNTWVRPNTDQMPGACREWFTPQNLVHVREGDFSVAWATPDAPLITLTDINRGRWLDHLPLTNGHVFSYAMNNYWFTNYRAEQGGRFVFRYSLTSGRDLSREALAHFDQDIRTPVLAYAHRSSFSAAISQVGRPMPPRGASFFELDAPNLEWVTLKEAEDGEGFILRLREVAGRAGETALHLPLFRVREAWLCNGVEENQRRLRTPNPHTVRVPYRPNAFTTIRLKLHCAVETESSGRTPVN